MNFCLYVIFEEKGILVQLHFGLLVLLAWLLTLGHHLIQVLLYLYFLGRSYGGLGGYGDR
jgi:hypothetical protein